MRLLAPLTVLALALAAHAIGGPAAAEASSASNLTTLQERLAALGYLPPTRVSGRMDEATRQAIVAFQGWAGLTRDGMLGSATRARLAGARRPEAGPRRGSRIEVYVGRQVALLVRGRRVVRAIHVSTGAPGTSTPTGRFRIFRKERASWSVPFHVWLPWASYFVGGVALHGSPDVPAYPASHGCVRIPSSEAPAVYAFAQLGLAVEVLA